MKSKKKLSLKKMNIAQLDAIKGGNIGNTSPLTIPDYPTNITCPDITKGDVTQDKVCQHTVRVSIVSCTSPFI